MPPLSLTTIAILCAGLVALVAYVTLILVPAWSSYGRLWERFAAAFLTLYVLATLVIVGGVAGFALVWFYDRFAATPA